jgi:predicted CoA-substrate-specific enzyme activase
MAVAGCDVGSLTAKVVIMEKGEILAHSVIRGGTKPEQSALEVLRIALESAGISSSDIAYAVGTGYGKERIAFVQDTESEIVCHARGAYWNLPDVRMVIDIGGQDAKVIRLDETGRVIRYVYNDKCASGTGRFLEVMSEILDVPLSEFGTYALSSCKEISITSTCTVFAESEITPLIAKGENPQEIALGLHRSVVRRAVGMLNRISLKDQVIFAGGVARNPCIHNLLEKTLNMKIVLPENPQINISSATS